MDVAFDDVERSGVEPLQIARASATLPLVEKEKESVEPAPVLFRGKPKEHYFLKEGCSYRFETNRILCGGKYIWDATIWQCEWPYGIITISPHFRTKWQAERWAKAYLKRGGPPEGFFDPPVDPNRVVYRKR